MFCLGVTSLGQSEENYRLLAENSTDMISRHDLEGHYLYASPACRSLLGYEPEELVGKPMHETAHYSHPDGTPYPAAECPMLRTVAGGNAHAVEDEVFWRKDGLALRVEYSASPVREQGQLSGAVVNFPALYAMR